MELKDLIDRMVGFSGVDNFCFCLVVDGKRIAFEAVEDEADGYRSMLQEVLQVPLKGRIFFRKPIVNVFVVEATGGGFEGYDLVDASGHRWLRLGTDNADDYYPVFTFQYTPRVEEN